VCESESDNDGCEGALSSTDNVAGVHGDLDVAGRGGDDGAVGAARRVTESLVSECTRKHKAHKHLPRP
jgi:hypothetical protein